MSENPIDLRIADDVAWLTLNRPAALNAMNGALCDAGVAALARIEADASVRAVVLSGAGTNFCAGGDLKSFRAQAEGTEAERRREATRLGKWLDGLDRLSKPLIGRINGPAHGGGVGLISVCDVAIGVEDAQFALSEVRIGLMPAMISPYVVRRIGVANSRRLMTTARRFGAAEAQRIGLLDLVVAHRDLDAAVASEIAELMKGAPGAVAGIKRLIGEVAGRPPGELLERSIGIVAGMWATPEAVEGTTAFTEKRKPAWAQPRG